MQRWQNGDIGGDGGSTAAAASFAAEAVAWWKHILVVVAVRLEVRQHCGSDGGDY